MVKYINLALLILFPLSWFAPLMRAGVLPIFGLSEISVISGLLTLFETDFALALVVLLFAIIAPLAKTLGLVSLHFDLAPKLPLNLIKTLGKLAMAEVFLIALYVVIAKGMTLTTIEPAWGLYLFTACILTSLIISYLTPDQ